MTGCMGSRNIKFLNSNPAVGRAQHSAHLQSHEALLVAERSSAGGGGRHLQAKAQECPVVANSALAAEFVSETLPRFTPYCEGRASQACAAGLPCAARIWH